MSYLESLNRWLHSSKRLTVDAMTTIQGNSELSDNDSQSSRGDGEQSYNQARHKKKNRTAIELDNLCKEFTSPDGSAITAVDSIDLTIREGEFFTLVGPSGCGKTTTLRMIAGLEAPTDGDIYFHGRRVTQDPANERNLAMMFQNIALYPHMRIKDNISYPLKVRNISKTDRYKQAADAADIMQISDLLEKYPADLSGGQRQRAALARTIVQDPIAFLMDEPLSDLDAKLQVEIRKEIQRIHAEINKPTIYVTHNQEEAMTMSDRIAVLNDGQIAQVGTPEKLYNEPASIFVGGFIGVPSMNFLDGNLVSMTENKATVSVYEKEFTWNIENVRRESAGDNVTIGFRPDVISLADTSAEYETDIQGSVNLIERIGDRLLAYVEGPENELRVTVDAGDDLSRGDKVSLHINNADMYLFDTQSGELIARGD